MIHTDGIPTIASAGSTSPRDGMSICFNDRLRRMTDGIGRGTYAGPERRQSGCPACVAEGRPAMQAGGCYRHDN